MPKSKKQPQGKKKKSSKARSDPLITARPPLQMVTGAPAPRKPSVGMIKAVHGHVNPFTEDVLGVKVHDSNSSNTYTYRTMTRAGYLVNGSNLYHGFTISPSLVAELNQWTTPGDVTSAWTNRTSTNNTSYTLIAANSAGLRMVSWGVRLSCTCPYTVADGMIAIATIRGDPGTPTNAQTLNPNAWLSYSIIPLKELDHVWIAKRADSSISDTFNPAADTYSSASVAGWTSVVIQFIPSAGAASAGTSGAAINFEIVKNFEIVPLVNTLSAGIATPAAPESASLRAAVDRIQSTTAHVGKTEEHQTTIGQKVQKVAQAVLMDGIDFFAPKLSQAFFGKKSHPSIMDID